MPLTLSGRKVNATTTEHPSLMDIAIGLSRMPRFAGQTRQWFSVLDHTMFGLELAKNYHTTTRLAWLLHDAHEAITGDVPTDVKGDDLRALQSELDDRIYGAFFPDYDRDDVLWWVKETDQRCLRAEALVLKGVEIGGTPRTDDVALLKSLLYRPLAGSYPKPGTLGVPPLAERQEEHPLVEAYIARMIELM